MDVEYKIYKAFYDLKAYELYFNQIREITSLSHSSLQNILGKLVKNNILEIYKTKSHVFYKIKDKKIFVLRFAELSVIKFRSLPRGVRFPLNEFLNNLEECVYTVVLFGSCAVGQERENSDIDILVVADRKPELDKIKRQVELMSNYPLNLFYCNVNEFKEAGDHIVNQAVETGFPIKGEQNFFEVLL